MTTPICRPCIGLGCDNPDDLAAGVDAALYSTIDYSFIVQCPPLCFCPPGLFPQTISILASTIPPVIPPIIEPGEQIILRLQGCTSLITRTLDPGSTQDQIAAAAQSMQAEWAGQQSLCDALLVPGVNCQHSDFIDVCNDAQNFVCPYNGLVINTPACTYSQRLSTIGLTQAQIDAATAVIKANLNFLAQRTGGCDFLHVICSVAETFPGPGSGSVTVFVVNDGATTFDTSSFQLCNIGGGGCLNSVVPSIAPGGNASVISASPITAPFTIKYLGKIFFTDPTTNFTQNRFVTVHVNCAPP